MRKFSSATTTAHHQVKFFFENFFENFPRIMPKFQVQSANTSAIVAQCATVTPLALKRPVYNDSRHPTGAKKAGLQRHSRHPTGAEKAGAQRDHTPTTAERRHSTSYSRFTPDDTCQ